VELSDLPVLSRPFEWKNALFYETTDVDVVMAKLTTTMTKRELRAECELRINDKAWNGDDITKVGKIRRLTLSTLLRPSNESGTAALVYINLYRSQPAKSYLEGILVEFQVRSGDHELAYARYGIFRGLLASEVDDADHVFTFSSSDTLQSLSEYETLLSSAITDEQVPKHFNALSDKELLPALLSRSGPISSRVVDLQVLADATQQADCVRVLVTEHLEEMIDLLLEAFTLVDTDHDAVRLTVSILCNLSVFPPMKQYLRGKEFVTRALQLMETSHKDVAKSLEHFLKNVCSVS